MAVIKLKPTSPGRRGVVKVSRNHLHKGDGFAPLLEPQFQQAGRNHNGHITTRHNGGGHKHHYRVVDFRRAKDAIPAKVERIEYDPNRSAHLALVEFVKAGAIVVGVSRDGIKSHENFKARQNLPFDLLSDSEEVLCTRFAVIKLKSMYGKQVRGIERSTFLIDGKGVLRREWRGVKVAGHAQAVLDSVAQL